MSHPRVGYGVEWYVVRIAFSCGVNDGGKELYFSLAVLHRFFFFLSLSCMLASSYCWAVGLGQFVSMTLKPRRIFAKSPLMKRCAGNPYRPSHSSWFVEEQVGFQSFSCILWLILSNILWSKDWLSALLWNCCWVMQLLMTVQIISQCYHVSSSHL